jgi:protein N-lysine methyltransferase METTL21D
MQNLRKGDFSRTKVTGKRAIELGAGMGLAGLALAMLGANVMLTDVKEVLPLLRRNYENNLSPAALRGGSYLQGCSSVHCVWHTQRA